LRGELCRGEIGGARLRIGDVALDRTPDRAPDIRTQLACAEAV